MRTGEELLHPRKSMPRCGVKYSYAPTKFLRENFEFRTDHHSLNWILNIRNSSRRIARWRLQLARYEYEAEYRPEVTQNVADRVSRLRKSNEVHGVIDNEFSGCVIESSPSMLKRR